MARIQKVGPQDFSREVYFSPVPVVVDVYTDRVYAPKRRRWQTLIPGPWAHWAKLAFERYFLWKMRTGRVNWP